MGVGFVSSTPGSRTCASEIGYYSTPYVYALRSQCPGSGTQEISEIGVYTRLYSPGSGTVRLVLLEDDSANGSPSATQVTNSDTGTITVNNTSYAKKSYTYATKPQLTGGSYYWIACAWYAASLTHYISYNASGGTGAQLMSMAWPADSSWHSAENSYTYDLYAVYAEVLAGHPARKRLAGNPFTPFRKGVW